MESRQKGQGSHGETLNCTFGLRNYTHALLNCDSNPTQKDLLRARANIFNSNPLNMNFI
jgi:hypothetical protein